MIARVIRSVVLIALTGLTLTGCGRQVAKDPPEDPNLLATGPDYGSMPIPRPFIAGSVEAAGGLPAWAQCKELQFDAIVTANYPDGGLYLTEHQFALYPWSDGIQITAGEPRARLAWEVVKGRYSFEGDEDLDVSPLRDSYREYAEAVLQIVTAPVRMLDDGVVLTRRPMPVQRAGQWYQPIDAKYEPRKAASRDESNEQTGLSERYWMQGTYFQNRDKLLMDMIWLGNPVARKFLLIRGYDYAQVVDCEVLIPTKIEIFQSDSEAQFGPRIALIDLKQKQ